MDFVGENRPREHLRHTYPSGFVGEVRPSSRTMKYTGYSRCLQSPETELKTTNYDVSRTNQDLNLELEDVLSQKSLSKQQLTRVLNSCVVTLVRRLLTGHRVSKIEGCINVAMADREEFLSVQLDDHANEHPTSVPESVHIGGIKLKDPLPHTSKYHMNDDTSCEGSRPHSGGLSPYNGLGALSSQGHDRLHVGGIEAHGYISPSYQRQSEVFDQSDSEESGYTSNDRESLSDIGAEDANLSPGHDLQDVAEYRDNSSDEATDLEVPGLVIDLSTPITENVSSMTNSIDKVYMKKTLGMGEVVEEPEKLKEMFKEPEKLKDKCNFEDKLNAQSQELCFDVDSDVPMDLSGDSKIAADVQTSSTDCETDRDDVSKETELTCKKCLVTMPDTQRYQEHSLQCHQQYSCATCNKDFSSKNNLKRHVRIHTGFRPYKCGQCDMSFARRDDLKGHTLRHNYNKPFRCSLCGKGYTDRACVKNHMSKEHCSRKMYICPQCGESFDQDDAFLEHKKSHPSLKQFACKTCPFIGTNHLMSLKHRLLHSHKLFSCKPCNAYFSDPFGYTKHVQKHKKDSSFIDYVCCFCDTVLPIYEQFVRHEYSHAQGKLHECKVCKKQFRSKASMLEHALIHGNDQKSECPITNTQVDVQDQNEVTVNIVENKPTSASPIVSNPCYEASDVEPPTDTPMNTEVVGQNRYSTNALDLRLKPSLSDDSCLKEQPSAGSVEPTKVVDISSIRALSLSNNNVPRNGCVALETRALKQETSHSECFSTDCQPDSSNDKEYKRIWQSPAVCTKPFVEKMENIDSNKKQNNLDTTWDVHKMDKWEMTSRLHKARSIELKQNRPRPYNKMVEFACKYVAARGGLSNKLLKEIGNTPAETLRKTEQMKQSNISEAQTLLKKLMTEKKLNSTVILSERRESAVEKGRGGSESLSSNVVIGLSGKPCLALIKEEENEKKETELPRPNATPDIVSHKGNSTFNASLKEISAGSESVSSASPSLIRDCDICNASFPSFFELESHSVLNHNRYLCEFCGKGFTARPNRDRHVRFHTGERPYKCDLCTRAFFRGDDLKYHRTTRHSTEQISCNRCSASFTWRKDLERHLRHSKCVS